MDLEEPERGRAEARGERAVGGVAPARHQDAPDPRLVVAGIEGMPFAAQIDVEPGRKVDLEGLAGQESLLSAPAPTLDLEEEHALGDKGAVQVLELAHAVVEFEEVLVCRGPPLLQRRGVEGESGAVQVLDEERRADGEEERGRVDLPARRSKSSSGGSTRTDEAGSWTHSQTFSGNARS